MKTLNQDIKSGQFRPVYLLTGSEAFLRASYRRSLVQALLGDDTMNLTRFEGRDVNPQDVCDAAETLPFLAEHRVVLVENSGLFERDAGPLPDYLDRMPETTVLIFSEDKADKRSRLYKKVTSLGYAAYLEPQTPSALTQWLASLASRSGCRLSREAASMLLSQAGSDMNRLKNELDKLISYAGEGGDITPETVELLGQVMPEDRIFEMISAISDGSSARALRLYSDLLELQVKPERMINLVQRQYRQLLHIRLVSEEGGSTDEAAKSAGVSPYIASKLVRASRRFSTAELRARLEQAVAAEEDFKSGRISGQLAMESLFAHTD